MKIKNVLISILIIIIMMIIISNNCYAENNIVVSINEDIVELKNQPVEIRDGVIMLPIEEILTNMNINWKWESDEKTFIVSDGEREYKFTLNDIKYSVTNINGKTYAYNNRMKKLDNAPLKIGNITMMSAEDIGNCFSYEVEYLNSSNTLKFKEIKNNKIEEILNSNSIAVDGGKEDFKKPLFKIDSEVYVPLSEFLDKLCIPYVINWDANYNYNKYGGFNALVNVRTYKKETPLIGDTKKNENGIIPDKETAYNIGKEILEKYAGREMEYTASNGSFYLKVYSETNIWRVEQVYKDKSGKVRDYVLHKPFICLSKNSGEVVSICTEIHDRAKK